MNFPYKVFRHFQVILALHFVSYLFIHFIEFFNFVYSKYSPINIVIAEFIPDFNFISSNPL